MGFFDQLRSVKTKILSNEARNNQASIENSLLLIDEGNAFESAGKIDKAMQCYEAAYRSTPTLARAHLNCGNIYLLQGDFDSAVSAYEMAISNAPDYASAHFNLGNAFLHSNRLEEAISAYQKAIQLKPDFVDAHVALGYAFEELGNLEGSATSYRYALGIKPDYVEVHCNLGSVLTTLDQKDGALVSFRCAYELNPDYLSALSGLTNVLLGLEKWDELLAIIQNEAIRKPDSGEILNNLGIALRAAGRFDEALESHRKALELSPRLAAAHYQLGLCLQTLGQHDKSIASYRRALEIDPSQIDTYSKLGNELMELGCPDEAAVIFQQALTIKPDLAEAHFNLGTAFNQLGQLNSAIACFKEALRIKPEFSGAYNNLGVSQQNLGKLDDALASFRRALELDPKLVHAQSNMGLTLNEYRRINEAIVCFRKALEINPEFGEAEVNLGMAYAGLGQLEKALPHVRKGMEIMPENTAAHTSLLFLHNYLNDQPAAYLLEEAKRFGELVKRKAPLAYTTWSNTPDSERRLRIGFVSGDFRRHPVGFFLEGVLSALASNAHQRLELFAYSNFFQNDAITERLKQCCDSWHLIAGISDKAVSEKIYRDEIDILIDLSGHTMYNRLPLFAWKPSPIQISWLGYFATTGVGAIDYLLADPWTLPETEEGNFTEKITRLPETRLCFTAPDEKVEVLSPPALSKGHITFGCFNTLTKMNDEVVALWSKILNTVPNSVLFLMSHQIDEPLVEQRTIARFKAHGIDQQRLILRGFAPREEYFKAYNEVDIALDPFPYCGGTTSVEALWMGVPVLTLAGEHFLSRQGVGLMMNAGLPEWVASDRDDYVARAVAHASHPEKLAILRRGMRKQLLASPIFDSMRFAKHFEITLRGIWKTWCSQRPPKH